jgi:predicted Zn finger-like uncharacterized protein
VRDESAGCLMVIECINCSRKFNLNENLLKPAGSRVRCSKCGTIFHACPAPNGGSLNPALEADGMAQGVDQDQNAAPFFEKRKLPRVPVSIPVLCDALDLEGNPSDIHLGAIKEVSQAGLAIELFTSRISEQVSLTFIDVENNEVQIEARVVHSRIKSFMTWIGLSLVGPPMEIEHFVAQAMKTHQISCSGDLQVQL